MPRIAKVVFPDILHYTTQSRKLSIKYFTGDKDRVRYLSLVAESNLVF